MPDDSVYYGPIINQQGFDKIRRYNKIVQDDPEAEVLLTPRYSGGERSYYSSPMVYKSEWRDAEYLKNEVFGPHVAIIPFDTIEDAIDIYNDTDYGLAVGILTNDFRKARLMRDECDAGNGFPSAARTYRAVTHEISWTVNHANRLTFPQGMK